MKIELRHWAKIFKADVELNGITVLAGGNGVGKSSLCKALMTLSSLTGHIEQRIESERRRSADEQFGRWVTELLRAEQGCLSMFHSPRGRSSDDWRSTFAGDPSAVFQDRVLLLSDDEAKKNACLKTFVTAYPKWQIILEQILSRPVEEYVGFVVQKAFNRAFKGQIEPLNKGRWAPFVQISEGSDRVSVAFENSASPVISPRTLSSNAFGFGCFYLEPCHLLDFCEDRGQHEPQTPDDRYRAGEFSWAQVLHTDPLSQSEYLTLEAQQRLTQVKEILAGIIDTLHGHLDLAEHRLVFKDKNIAQPIRLENLASGVKSMAVIVRALELGAIRQGDMLIIDEPEANLHPEWQIEFARFLVELQHRLSIRLVLSTHSPYFLMAVKTFVKKLSMEPVCRFYNFVESSEYEGMYETRDVTGSVDEIFRDMYRPLDMLEL